MATVDLDKLSAELTAAGLVCKIEDDSVFADTPKKKNQIQRRWRITAFGHVHQGQVYWGEWGDRGTLLVNDWKYLDIIRRHVAPVAPDPGLREAIAKRIKAVEHSELVDLGYVEAITAAVLAERGVR